VGSGAAATSSTSTRAGGHPAGARQVGLLQPVAGGSIFERVGVHRASSYYDGRLHWVLKKAASTAVFAGMNGLVAWAWFCRPVLECGSCAFSCSHAVKINPGGAFHPLQGWTSDCVLLQPCNTRSSPPCAHLRGVPGWPGADAPSSSPAGAAPSCHSCSSRLQVSLHLHLKPSRIPWVPGYCCRRC
jgi:hypothetical protein